MTRAHPVRSSILYSMGRTGEAVAACEEAARLDPDDKGIAEALAEVRRLTGGAGGAPNSK